MSGMKLLSRSQIKSLKNAIEGDFDFDNGQLVGGLSVLQGEDLGRLEMELARIAKLRDDRYAAIKLIRRQQDWIRNTIDQSKWLD